MDADAIIQFLKRSGVGSDRTVIECADRTYALPALDWITDEFARAWAVESGQLGLQYDPEAEDCDDFARLCAGFAQRCHARTPGRAAGTALAFGECWYALDAGGGHAVNCFLTSVVDFDQKSRPLLRFFEPQTGTLLGLTPSELRNIEFLRL